MSAERSTFHPAALTSSPFNEGTRGPRVRWGFIARFNARGSFNARFNTGPVGPIPGGPVGVQAWAPATAPWGIPKFPTCPNRRGDDFLSSASRLQHLHNFVASGETGQIPHPICSQGCASCTPRRVNALTQGGLRAADRAADNRFAIGFQLDEDRI
jgi:hypothetical protein